MTPTSKILGAVVLLALIGTAAFVLSTSENEPEQPIPVAGSSSIARVSSKTDELASPSETLEVKEAIEQRAPAVEVVKETREEKRARKRAKGPFLRGRVLDAYGNPIKAALVEVSSWQAAAQGMMLVGMGGGSGAPKASSKNTVKTDDEGRFSAYRDSKFGLDVAVTIGARGFLVAKERELLGEDGTLDLGDYRLEPGAVITGIVLDQDNEPVEGAQIKRVDDSKGGMMEMSGMFLEEMGMGGMVGGNQSDAEGKFELAHEEPGEFELSFRHKDFPNTNFEGETAPAGAEPIPIVVRMKPTASIAGRLEDMPTDRDKVFIYARAIESTGEMDTIASMFGDMGLFSGGSKCKVSPDGSYELKGLEPAGRYELRAIEKAGMFSRKPCSETVKATAGDSDVELRFDPGASLSFRVVDARTGDPITQLEVRHTWSDGSNMFAAMAASFNGSEEEGHPNGEVVLSELRPKEDPSDLELRITSPGYLEYGRDNISIAIDSSVELGTIRLQVAPLVRVQVVAASSGKPVARARVRIKNSAEVSMEDFARPSTGGGVSVEVNLGDAPAMSDLFGSKTLSGKTDADGWCELPAFGMQDAVLTVRSPKFSNFTKDGLTIKASGTTILNARLVRGGEVRIEVLDSAGRPVPGALVLHRGPDGEDLKSKTSNQKGEARFRRVLPGSHSFMAKHDTNAFRGMFGNVNFGSDDDEEKQDEWMTIGVQDGGTSRLKLLAPGLCNLEGLVTSNGAALVGATVSLSTNDDENEILSRIGGAFGEMLANGGMNDVTNQNGLYEIASIPVREYSLIVKHPDRAMPAILKVKLQPGDNRFDATLALTSLEGRVVDANGDPVMGANLTVLHGETNLEIMNAVGQVDGPMSEFRGDGPVSKSTSRADGSFTIHGVLPDTPIFVLARREGYTSGHSKSVKVSEGSVKSGLKIEVLVSGSIRVVVTGQATAFSTVQAVFKGELKEGESLGAKIAFVRNGKAVLKDLRAGPWEVRMSNDDEEANVRTVTVEAGSQAIVDLTAP